MFALRSVPSLLAPTLVVALAAALVPQAVAGQQAPAATAEGPDAAAGYADAADLTLAAPVIADVTIASAARIKGVEAASVAPGLTRFYVEADVGALIRGAGGVPPRVGYLVDVAPDAGGRVPRLKKQRVLVFAKPVAGGTDQLQLVAPDAQRPWSPALEARVRGIAAAAAAADAPPVVTGLGNAFHVPGNLPGEGETQVFLTTADHRPVSLSIIRRPGEAPRWGVALGEIVDEAAAPPARGTLLWYRLACFLPATLPDHSTASLAASDADQARADYRFVIESLGPCRRARDDAPG